MPSTTDEWVPLFPDLEPTDLKDWSIERRLNLAIQDPGRVVSRLRRRHDFNDGGDEWEYEWVPTWQRRAIQKVLANWFADCRRAHQWTCDYLSAPLAGKGNCTCGAEARNNMLARLAEEING